MKKTINSLKPKILIVGGSGYIGCQISSLLNPSIYDITILDFNFISKIEKKLKQKKIKIVKDNIFNFNIQKFDLIINLAYITDVTRIKDQLLTKYNSNSKQINIEALQYILQNCNPNCKIIYPSTHVVFEGIASNKLDIPVINENTKPLPKSIYSKQKVQNEIDIIKSERNFIIFRLGSVYGLNDNINTKILINLFSLLSVKNKTLTLFSGGINHKPIVCVKDVARAIKFMVQDHFGKRKFNKEIYNLSNQTLKVAEIAKICKKYLPSVKIIKSNDPIPNLGYILSDKKITDTGFHFTENAENHIRKMINHWKKNDT